ncbi:retrotransposon protein, putative, unclassified [Panicum miliaceum]|uniref:Retrotransposon protein, putative, unclassified n=1 Tax=Panicum miliaceum TaxID=4540 RepID=A0A3L6TMS0_PANMI|nr:retrotransposon protein, putative, unclassified [Panicum miliaceum]
MSNWRPWMVKEEQLEVFVVKGLLRPKATTHWRAPLATHEVLHPNPGRGIARTGRGFGLPKKPWLGGDYPAYTPSDSNHGWHDEWFYLKNPAEKPFPTYTGGRPERQESWTWGTLPA